MKTFIINNTLPTSPRVTTPQIHIHFCVTPVQTKNLKKNNIFPTLTLQHTANKETYLSCTFPIPWSVMAPDSDSESGMDSCVCRCWATEALGDAVPLLRFMGGDVRETFSTSGSFRFGLSERSCEIYSILKITFKKTCFPWKCGSYIFHSSWLAEINITHR